MDQQSVFDSVVDTVGVALAGSREPACRLLGDYTRTTAAPGAAAVWGTADRLAPASAALLNGTAAMAQEFDDRHVRHGHPRIREQGKVESQPLRVAGVAFRRRRVHAEWLDTFALVQGQVIAHGGQLAVSAGGVVAGIEGEQHPMRRQHVAERVPASIGPGE